MPVCNSKKSAQYAFTCRVIVQLAPTIRDDGDRYLSPAVVGGILAGVLLMYVTGLLVSV